MLVLVGKKSLLKKSRFTKLIVDLKSSQNYPKCLKGKAINFLNLNISWSDLQTEFSLISQGHYINLIPKI